MAYVHTSSWQSRCLWLLLQDDLGLTLQGADAPMGPRLVGPALAPEHSCHRKRQEVGQAGTEPRQRRVRMCAPSPSVSIPHRSSPSPPPLPATRSFSHPRPHTQSPAHTQYTHPPEIVGWKDLGSGATSAWCLTPGLPSCVTLNKALCLSQPYSPCLSNGHNNPVETSQPTWLVQVVDQVIQSLATERQS